MGPGYIRRTCAPPMADVLGSLVEQHDLLVDRVEALGEAGTPDVFLHCVLDFLAGDIANHVHDPAIRRIASLRAAQLGPSDLGYHLAEAVAHLCAAVAAATDKLHRPEARLDATAYLERAHGAMEAYDAVWTAHTIDEIARLGELPEYGPAHGGRGHAAALEAN